MSTAYDVPGNLDKLLEEIGPDWAESQENAADGVLRRFEKSFRVSADAVATRSELCRFVEEIRQELGRQSRDGPFPDEVLWQRFIRPRLTKLIGPHPEQALGDIVGTEKDMDGLYGLLRSMTRLIVSEHIQERVAQRVDAFISPLTASELLSAGEEYLRRFDALIPTEMKAGFATRIRVNLSAVLREHHKIVRRVQRLPLP